MMQGTRRSFSVFVLLLVVANVLAQEPGVSDRRPFEREERDELAVLLATQQAFRAVRDQVKPYLVRIETVGGTQPGRAGDVAEVAGDEGDDGEPNRDGQRARRRQSAFVDDPGSGFVVADGPTTGVVYSADGYIITSSFNFVRNPILITVRLADGRRLAADLVARDQVRKIALLKVDAENLPVPLWSSRSEVRVGQWAIALGLGFSGEDAAITVGIVSAHNRMFGNAIQTDAKLSPANYGGPLCDLYGRFIGICVPMAQRAGELAGVEMYDSGVGFAVPKERVDEIVDVLKTGQSFYRGWLGIQIDPRTSDPLVIANVAVPSPMDDVGARSGDAILAINGERIRHFGQLRQSLYMLPAGEDAQLDLGRGEDRFSVVVRLARNTELGALPDLEEPPEADLPLSDPDNPD